MRVRMTALAGALEVGKNVADTIVYGESGTEAYKAVDSIIGITKMPAIEVTSTRKSPDNYTYVIFNQDHTKNKGGNAAMIYVKNPSNKEVQLRISFNFKDDKNMYTGSMFGGNDARCFQILSKDSTEWENVSVTSYLGAIPANFEGYVKYDYEDLYLSKLNAYAIDDTMGLVETWVLFYNLDVNQKLVVSAPIIIEDFSEEAVHNKAFVEDETKIARDLFTAEPYIIGAGGSGNSGGSSGTTPGAKPLTKGDTITKLPKATTDLKAKFSDKTKLYEGKATVSWDATSGASKYVVRVFKNSVSASGSGMAYNYISDYTVTSGTSVEVSGFAKDTRYTVIVYAYNASGSEIAVYESISVSTIGAKAPEVSGTTSSATTGTTSKDDTTNTSSAATDTDTVTDSEGGLSTGALIAIIAGAVVLLAGAAVVVVLVIKKRKVA